MIWYRAPIFRQLFLYCSDIIGLVQFGSRAGGGEQIEKYGEKVLLMVGVFGHPLGYPIVWWC
jgi:hypothetical protein